MKLAYSTLVKTYEAWKQFTRDETQARLDREQHALRMAGRCFIPYVGLCFEAWVSQTATTIAIKKRAAFAIGPGRLLHMVIRTWAHNAREQKRQAERDWVTGLMEESLPAMIATTIEREIKLVESRMGAQDGVAAAMKEANAALQAEVDDLRRQIDTANERSMREKENSINRILRTWKQSHISRAFHAWQADVAAAQAMHRQATAEGRSLALRHATRDWSELTSYKKALRDAARMVFLGYERRVAVQIMKEWRQVAARSIHDRRSGGLRALMLWTNRTLENFFYPWQDYTRKSQLVKVMFATAIQRMQGGILAAAFDALAAHVRDVQDTRSDMLKTAVRRMMNSTLQKTFCAWQQMALDSIEERHASYVRAVSRFFNRKLALVFDAWREFLDRKFVILQRAAYVFGDGHLIATMFGRWRELWGHYANIKKTQWLLQDLKLVGKGWLVETFDQVLSSSVPVNTQLHASVAHAIELAAAMPPPAYSPPFFRPSAVAPRPVTPPVAAPLFSTTEVVTSEDVMLDVMPPRREPPSASVVNPADKIAALRQRAIKGELLTREELMLLQDDPSDEDSEADVAEWSTSPRPAMTYSPEPPIEPDADASPERIAELRSRVAQGGLLTQQELELLQADADKVAELRGRAIRGELLTREELALLRDDVPSDDDESELDGSESSVMQPQPPLVPQPPGAPLQAAIRRGRPHQLLQLSGVYQFWI